MAADVLVVVCISGVPLALSLFAFMKEDVTLATYIRCGLAAEATPWVAAAAAIRLGFPPLSGPI